MITTESPTEVSSIASTGRDKRTENPSAERIAEVSLQADTSIGIPSVLQIELMSAENGVFIPGSRSDIEVGLVS